MSFLSIMLLQNLQSPFLRTTRCLTIRDINQRHPCSSIHYNHPPIHSLNKYLNTLNGQDAALRMGNTKLVQPVTSIGLLTFLWDVDSSVYRLKQYWNQLNLNNMEKQYNIQPYGSDRIRIIQRIKLEIVSTRFKPSVGNSSLQWLLETHSRRENRFNYSL